MHISVLWNESIKQCFLVFFLLYFSPFLVTLWKWECLPSFPPPWQARSLFLYLCWHVHHVFLPVAHKIQRQDLSETCALCTPTLFVSVCPRYWIKTHITGSFFTMKDESSNAFRWERQATLLHLDATLKNNFLSIGCDCKHLQTRIPNCTPSIEQLGEL